MMDWGDRAWQWVELMDWGGGARVMVWMEPEQWLGVMETGQWTSG